ncbi:MAG: T9SS type A sorting domain-containing protein [Prolixibacteraceae bacterium]|nr:T9SS type A sorting domain-containing protein [Prolixibacteraceae bacterium]
MMKQFFTFFALIFFVMNVSAQKNVAYVTKEKELDATAATVDNDGIIQMLNDDSNINLTVFVCDGDGNEIGTANPIDLNGFDAIIAQETFGSGDNVWKEGYPLYIGTLPAPTLFNKVYALRSGRGLPGGSGASADATGVLDIAVVPGMEEHPIFNGITIDGGIIQVCWSGANDLGAEGEKTIQYNTGNVLSDENTLLAYPDGIDMPVIAINDLPEGSYIDDVALFSRVIVFNFNFGQLVKLGATNLTDEGLMLWKNAVYSLAGLDGNAVNNLEIIPFSFSQEGRALTLSFSEMQNTEINIYNIAGKIVKTLQLNGTSANIDLSSMQKGIYILNVAGLNSSQKFVLK